MTSTPGDISRTFGSESGLYGGAGFLPTPVPQDKSGVASIAEEPESEDEDSDIELVAPAARTPAGPAPSGLWPQSIDEQWEHLHRIREAERAAALPSITAAVSEFGSYVLNGIISVLHTLISFFQVGWTTFRAMKKRWLIVLAFLAGLIFSQAGFQSPLPSALPDMFSTGGDLISSAASAIRGYLPVSSHTSSYTWNGNKDDLEQRISVIERELNALKKRTKLDQEAIQHIEKRLPDFVVFKKGKKGREKQVPTDFWHAIKAMIREESPVIKDYLIQNGTIHPAAGELTEKQVKKYAKSAWVDFLENNEERIRIWTGETSEDIWKQKLKEAFKNDVLVPRSEVMDLITQSYADSHRLVKTEISKLNSQFSHQLRHASPENDNPYSVGLTEAQVKAIAHDTIKKMGHAIALEALANHKIKQATSDSLQRVNHFSPRLSAVVNMKYTSPTFAMPSSKTPWIPWMLVKMIGWGLPPANPPIVALTKWDEAGDCWCSPAKGEGPVQLAVLMKHEIYPDEIVIEHIPATATLEPGAAPRSIDVFAKVETDPERLGDIIKVSEKVFNEVASGPPFDVDFVRIARFTYDPFDNPDHYRQTFQVKLDLKNFNVPTQEIVIRAVSNAGADHTCLYRVMVHGDVHEVAE